MRALTPEDPKTWQKLVAAWEDAAQDSRAATNAIARQMNLCYEKKGGNPTIEEMDAADTMRAKEKAARDAMDAFIKECFH